MVGRTILQYRITEKLGEGGMGVVYKAEDTQLRRTVALKFLPRETLDEEEVKARLIREAQAAAALDHPNICQVFGIHEEDGETFIAMAYIDGPSLAEKIKERPLPLDESLTIATQIAEGLHEAHEKGVVHRDIKPQNILLTAKGQVKILDFGLASLTGRSKLTKTGTTLGTPAYMAPEQLEGKGVDRRADVWALGCVLYEMLTQKTPFDADYEQAIGYGILNEDPEPVTAQRAGLPTEIDRLLSKALAKPPDERYQHADDMLADLRVLQKQTAVRKTPSGSSTTLATSPTVSAIDALPPDSVVVRRSSQRIARALAAVLSIALLAVLTVHFTEVSPEPPLRRFSLDTPSDLNTLLVNGGIAISPDGKHIAYATTSAAGMLWVQDLDQDEPRELAGTEGARRPFWSPDSQFIAFATADELKKISVDGGAIGLICPLPRSSAFGGAWSPTGESIVFSGRGGRGVLHEVSAQGGVPEEHQVVQAELDERVEFASGPRFLLGEAGRILLFTVGNYAAGTMYVKNLDTGQTEVLGPGDNPVYSASSGHLIYQPARGTHDLWARSFSRQMFQFTGVAFPLRKNAQKPSVSEDGTLTYLDGAGSAAAKTLVWRDRAGELLEVIGQPQPRMAVPALSPDGQRIAVTSNESGNFDIWVHDLIRSTKTRLTFGPELENFPAWSPDGQEIAYRILNSGRRRLMRRTRDGTGEAAVLVEADTGMYSLEWSRDGRYLIYRVGNPGNISYLRLKTDGTASEPITFLSTPAHEDNPKFSPDGRFLVFVSNESGRNEVYVRPFPDGAGRWQVSVSGGGQARWRGDGRELYYVEGDTLMAVSVSTEQGFVLGQPQRLFEDEDLIAAYSAPNYDVSTDGQRFVTVMPVEEEEPSSLKIRVVQNWYEEFRDREE